MTQSSSQDVSFASSIAEISWNAFEKNWNLLASKLTNSTRILPMVKANAYGHDLSIISNYCSKLSAVGLGVANIFEALELRSLGYENRIISFGRLSPEALDAAFEFQIQVVVHHLDDVNLLANCAHPIVFHVEIETGMHRLGIGSDEIHEVSALLQKKPHRMEGVFTHLAESEIKGSDFTKSQLKNFDRAFAQLQTSSKHKLISHVENSGGILNLKKHYDWVRPGIALYGFHPDAKNQRQTLTPVMEWMVPIMQITKIKKGDFVSYNRSFKARKDMTIATLPVGYGDGFSREYRSLSVGYKNRKCAILGNICMDLCMIDVTHIKNPQVNEMVYLMGAGNHGEPTALNYAKVEQTIPYEVLTRISPRVIRTQTP